MKTSITFFLLLVVFLTATTAAQIKPPADKDDVIRIDTQLVDVPVAVVNEKGNAVAGLKKGDFRVLEDGKLQEIVDFSATSEPFEVALLLDTSGSTRSDLQLIQRAANEFVSSLRSGDRVSVTAYRSDVADGRAFAVSETLSRLTGDRAALRDAIARAKMSGGTPFYDSIIQIVEDIFRDAPAGDFRGRRALVALTDGVDSTSSTGFAEIKEKLGKLGIVCFFIKVDTREFFEEGLLGDCQTATRFSTAQIRRYYRSLGAKGNYEKATSFCQLGEFERLAVSKKLYEIADAEMLEVAKISGGKVFPLAELSDARDAFKSVAAELGSKYTLGYNPSNEKRDGTYRKIRVDVIGLPKATLVRARDGYTAPTQ
ncbi:MAG: VWA domain-containing protein [Chloracidobacterium sp.]|nr:VWA domain-containing protein [Chloracidobacterium sp.]